ncbi:PREDICTED: LOC110757381 [Prunus dulcis]|uniref:PREDICTED: LOC110757381 n=1 Tax=Prunus dulcis TaxID=3755 RepID=A0A5E4FRX7_PRUDU|nr:PREDICTED: LOC110757381 [Prunus dulcis]
MSVYGEKEDLDHELAFAPFQGEPIFCNSFSFPPNQHVGQSSSALSHSAGRSGQEVTIQQTSDCRHLENGLNGGREDSSQCGNGWPKIAARCDWNEILRNHEKKGGLALSPSRPRYLHDFMNKANLMDLGFCSPRFTWDAVQRNNEGNARVEGVVTPQMNDDLLQPITLDDAKAAAFKLGSLKAPGLDGF